MKFRIGLDDDLITFRDAGRIGEQEGCAAVALHARTAAQLYDGEADWSAIMELKQLVRTIPVLGNGDLFEAADALRMMRETGCDGVVVGRGCLGRPWLFRDLDAVFDGRPAPPAPAFGEVRRTASLHARLLVDWAGEHRAMREFRKHISWYAKGYRLGPGVRRQLAGIETVTDLERLLSGLNPDAVVVEESLRCSRAKRSGRQRVSLPDGYLDDLDDDTPPDGAHDPGSGG
jgi:nifR3 family TIM-barrel protein